MKPFLTKSILLIALCLLMGYLLQFPIDSGLRKSDMVPEFKEWYDVDNGKINADMVILGSSRAKSAFSPSALKTAFGLNVYNLGMDGVAFPLQNFRFNRYLKYNTKPQYIIQVIEPELLAPNIPSPCQQFVPYLNQEFIEKYKKSLIFTWRDVYIPLYKYSHWVGTVNFGLANIFNKTVKENDTDYGFMAKDLPFHPKAYSYLFVNKPHSLSPLCEPAAYKQFISFLTTCQRQHIKLILVAPPTCKSYQNLYKPNSFYNLYNELADKYHFKFIDLETDPMTSDTTFFLDIIHLNKKGSELMNKKLIEKLTPLIKEELPPSIASRNKIQKGKML